MRFERLTQGQPYIVKVFPMRHRPVSQFAFAGPEADPPVVQLFCPLHPERVRAVTFPEYENIAAELRRVLACSQVEGIDGQGAAVYAALTSLQKSGAVQPVRQDVGNFGFDEQRIDLEASWTRLFRVRADRIFADVQPALRDLVKSGVASVAVPLSLGLAAHAATRLRARPDPSRRPNSMGTSS